MREDLTYLFWCEDHLLLSHYGSENLNDSWWGKTSAHPPLPMHRPFVLFNHEGESPSSIWLWEDFAHFFTSCCPIPSHPTDSENFNNSWWVNLTHLFLCTDLLLSWSILRERENANESWLTHWLTDTLSQSVSTSSSSCTDLFLSYSIMRERTQTTADTSSGEKTSHCPILSYPVESENFNESWWWEDLTHLYLCKDLL